MIDVVGKDVGCGNHEFGGDNEARLSFQRPPLHVASLICARECYLIDVLYGYRRGNPGKKKELSTIDPTPHSIK